VRCLMLAASSTATMVRPVSQANVLRTFKLRGHCSSRDRRCLARARWSARHFAPSAVPRRAQSGVISGCRRNTRTLLARSGRLRETPDCPASRPLAAGAARCFAQSGRRGCLGDAAATPAQSLRPLRAIRAADSESKCLVAATGIGGNRSISRWFDASRTSQLALTTRR
jgi:hypothetical protein